MKKKCVIIIVIVVLLLFFVGLGTLFYFKSKEFKVTLVKDLKAEINSKVYDIDYIKKIKNGKIKGKKTAIDTSKLGEKKVNLIITDYFKKKKKYSYIIKIVDTEKPTITFNNEIKVYASEEVDLLKGVSASDNSKEEIVVEVSGDYDINKPDTYKLFYIAKDSSGNETTEEFSLIVLEKPKVKPEDVGSVNTSFKTSKGFTGTIKNGITYIDGYLIANKSYPLPSTYNPGLDSNVKSKAEIMFVTARNEGLNIYISSGFRSYNTQKNLYNNYVNRDGKAAADTYSARPGHSEHQTGLAFDVNQISSSFDNTAEAKWLSGNCYKYGFILRYPKGKDNETGYMYESWHFRYVGESLASKLYNGGDWITMESYFGIKSEYNY